jgi:hypothetical protein
MMPETRNSLRYSVRAPVFFKWSDLQSRLRHGEGITRDISSGGLFVWSPEAPPAGALAEVEVLLPRLLDGGTGLSIHASGRVTRLEGQASDNQKTGFGLCLERVVLHGLDDLLVSDNEENEEEEKGQERAN